MPSVVELCLKELNDKFKLMRIVPSAELMDPIVHITSFGMDFLAVIIECD